MRAIRLGGVLVFVVTATGCVAAVPLALQAVPLTLQAVEAVGAGVVHLADASAIESHRPEYASELRKDEVCDDLINEVPMLAELRTDKTGKTEYRALGLTGNVFEPQWVTMFDESADPSGWKLANNFVKMDFQPPIQPLFEAGSVIYIAYAPDPAQDATEQNQLNALAVAFGPNFGTFRWNNRVYRYAAVQKLPCFSLPPVFLMRRNRPPRRATGLHTDALVDMNTRTALSGQDVRPRCSTLGRREKQRQRIHCMTAMT